MAESVKVIMALKRAANYSKLAMRDLGPRSYKRGQGALLKVIYRFGKEGALDKDAAKKVLDWRGKELRAVAKKAADNGYITIVSPETTFTMSLTPKGTEVIEKRLKAEDAAAESVLSGLTEEERETLLTLTQKVSDTCKGLGVDYDQVHKRQCKRRWSCGDKGGHGDGHGHHGHGPKGHHHAPQNVFVFKSDGCHEGHHHDHGHGPKGPKGKRL